MESTVPWSSHPTGLKAALWGRDNWTAERFVPTKDPFSMHGTNMAAVHSQPQEMEMLGAELFSVLKSDF